MDFSMSVNPGAFLGAGLSFIGGLQQQAQQSSMFAAQQALAREQMMRENTRFWDQWQTQQWATDRAENWQGHMAAVTHDRNLAMLREQMAKQEEFAKYGLQWKVADAKAAGLHPLFGLGGGASYSPVNAMSDAGSMGSASGPAGTGMGMPGLPATETSNPLRDVGQDLSRAIMATQTERERQEDQISDIQKRYMESQINLNNARASELQRSAMNAQIGPSFPDVNKGQRVGAVEVKPAENISHAPGSPSSEAGYNPQTKVVDTPHSIYAHPSKELNMDDLGSPGTATYHTTTTLAGMLGSKPTPEIVARAKQRWPNADGIMFVPALGWIPRYKDDWGNRIRGYLVPSLPKGNYEIGYPIK